MGMLGYFFCIKYIDFLNLLYFVNIKIILGCISLFVVCFIDFFILLLSFILI